MKAAVTGATGFVGSHLVEALRRAGHQVACLVRSPSKGVSLEAQGCSLVGGTLDQPSALPRLVEGAEVVFHVAGAMAARSEAEFLRVNRDGTGRLARASREAGVRRFVYVSSLAVTGPTAPGRPLDEAASPRPLTAYGRSKRAAEEAVRASGTPFTILRPPVVYGPRDRQLLRLFRLARRWVAPLLGDGRQELSLVHVADLAEALMAAAGPPATAGGTYHVGHPDVVTQRQLVESIGRAVGRRVRPIPLPGALVKAALHVTGAAARLGGRATVLSPEKAEEFLAPAWTCSSEALARDTGWRAAIPLERGLAETARWYEAEGWL